MLAHPGIVVAPGICDGISARCAIEAGFDCLYQRVKLLPLLRGWGKLIWLSLHQMTLSSPHQWISKFSMITCACPNIFLKQFRWTGNGSSHRHHYNMPRPVSQGCISGIKYRLNAVDIYLVKKIVSREEFVTRIRAAVIARDARLGNSNVVIIGRTDSTQVFGMDKGILRLDSCWMQGLMSTLWKASRLEDLNQPSRLSYRHHGYALSFYGGCKFVCR
ncbi:hypothetical protein PILCRDRAFT_502328 [Piloderma croceum F 1598]|uniref:Uncharacterized protein n=1 Tax=Piloderma croceum (strain F 1598) TaxID=765440 RepID=A0A0C3BVS3_PILCF|nr:hypothetical protein PILCRDRAFT_502328 [Piloderma croceum F 1598]